MSRGGQSYRVLESAVRDMRLHKLADRRQAELQQEREELAAISERFARYSQEVDALVRETTP